jgi:flagellar hook-associated protein 1
MSASALMSIGTRALTANYAALQTTGHNIANANTVGYSRQTVDFETAGGQFSGAGFFGKGVEISTIARAHSEYLTSEAATARSLAASDQSRSTQLQQLEKIFQIGENGLGYAAGQLFNSFADVAAKPQDLSADRSWTTSRPA